MRSRSWKELQLDSRIQGKVNTQAIPQGDAKERFKHTHRICWGTYSTAQWSEIRTIKMESFSQVPDHDWFVSIGPRLSHAFYASHFSPFRNAIIMVLTRNHKPDQIGAIKDETHSSMMAPQSGRNSRCVSPAPCIPMKTSELWVVESCARNGTCLEYSQVNAEMGWNWQRTEDTYAL